MSEFSTISRDSPMPLSNPQVNGKEGCDQCEELITQLNNQAVISSRYERMWSEAIAKCFKEEKAMEAIKEKLDRVEKTLDRKEKLYRQDVMWQGLRVVEEDVRHSDTRVTMEYLERMSNLQRSLQLVDKEFKDSQKKVKVLTDLVQELKRVGRGHHKLRSDMFGNDRKMREEVKNEWLGEERIMFFIWENDALYIDLENSRRLLPAVSGDVMVPHPVDFNCNEEKVILGLLTRADVDRSTIEVQPDGRVRLVVFNNDSSRVKELRQGLENVPKRAIIDTAIFVGFTSLDEQRMAIRFNGGNFPV
ncbi:hypothetical protein Aduo_003501 [Ancylostoma duodenale]